ncbi:MAG: GntR family transcriptional regulator [Oscillospiraceae bacterium]|jgi:GntR family transcriptional regulator|nr:GntR family transcriptional regulator [Oscillospiraceae bacterium]
MRNIVDKENPTPIYYQIEESIQRDISEGRLAPGDRLPTEQWLCAFYGVSRMTVRRAIQELINSGSVQRQRGHGPVVAPPRLVRPLSHFAGLYDTLAVQGIHLTTRVLSLETMPAASTEAERLRVRKGEPVLALRRVRYMDGFAIALQHTCLREEVVGPLRKEELESQSLYHLLADRGFHIEGGTQKFTATMPNKAQRDILEVSAQTPLLYTERTSRIEGGVPLEFSCSWYNSSRFSMTVELGR